MTCNILKVTHKPISWVGQHKTKLATEVLLEFAKHFSQFWAIITQEVVSYIMSSVEVFVTKMIIDKRKLL